MYISSIINYTYCQSFLLFSSWKRHKFRLFPTPLDSVLCPLLSSFHVHLRYETTHGSNHHLYVDDSQRHISSHSSSQSFRLTVNWLMSSLKSMYHLGLHAKFFLLHFLDPQWHQNYRSHSYALRNYFLLSPCCGIHHLILTSPLLISISPSKWYPSQRLRLYLNFWRLIQYQMQEGLTHVTSTEHTSSVMLAQAAQALKKRELHFLLWWSLHSVPERNTWLFHLFCVRVTWNLTFTNLK